jgi:hypothetical protein
MSVRVVRATERPPNHPIIVRCLDLTYNAIRSSHTGKRTNKNQNPVSVPLNFLPNITIPILTVVMQPQPARQTNGNGRKAQGSRERNQVGEDRDGFGENES